MKKELLLLILLGVLLIPPISNANPVGIEPITSGHVAPLGETPIYLKSEYISAVISDIVIERTEYTLKNSENSVINLSIALPFDIMGYSYHLPENLFLTVNGVEKAYNWSLFNYTNLRGYNATCSAAVFNVTFGPFEEKIVVANYSRTFFSGEGGIRSYGYLTETGRFWNRSIEYAHFHYSVDITMGRLSINGLEDCSFSFEGGYLVINKEFYNWTPEQNVGISFDSTPLLDPLYFPVFIIAIFPAALISRWAYKKMVNKTK